MRSAKKSCQKWLRLLISILIDECIVMKVFHVKGVENVEADCLSRNNLSKFVGTTMNGLKELPVMSPSSRMTLWSL